MALDFILVRCGRKVSLESKVTPRSLMAEAIGTISLKIVYLLGVTVRFKEKGIYLDLVVLILSCH